MRKMTLSGEEYVHVYLDGLSVAKVWRVDWEVEGWVGIPPDSNWGFKNGNDPKKFLNWPTKEKAATFLVNVCRKEE